MRRLIFAIAALAVPFGWLFVPAILMWRRARTKNVVKVIAPPRQTPVLKVMKGGKG